MPICACVHMDVYNAVLELTLGVDVCLTYLGPNP